MMYGDYSDNRSNGDRDYDKNYDCIKYTIYAVNVILFLCACAMVGGTIFILIEKTFVSDIMQNQLLTVGVWLIIIAGSLIILSVPICGCCGAVRGSKRLLGIYLGFLSLLFLMFLAGGICTIVLREKIDERILVKMEELLTDEYGVNMETKFNRFITLQWDKAQKDMYCCSVRDQGWGLYRQSKWYAEQPLLYGDSLSGSNGKPMVPESCCMLDRNDEPVDKEKCQMFTEGPPYRPGGATGSNQYNNAIHYRGCYDAAKQWIKYYGAWIIGFGIGSAGAMVLGIVFSLMMIIRLRK